jgi:hypothetical protein
VTWLCTAEVQLSLAHRTVRWCTGQCPVRQAGLRWTDRSRENLVAYDYNSPDCLVVHRTIRWANDRQRNGRPCNPQATRGPRQRSAGGTGLSSVHRTVRCAPDNVWCANCHESATVVCARIGRRSRTGHEQWLSGGAPDCLVRHPTEGKDSLLCWPPTAPSCLGAIKGTPRRMEESPKHSRNILRLLYFNFAHLILWDSDLSSIWVVNSESCVLSSSCDLCAWLCYDLSLVCVALPSLTSVHLFWSSL